MTSQYIEILETVFLEASDAHPNETSTIPFTWTHLHDVAQYAGVAPRNVPDILYSFRHERLPTPDIITRIAPAGYTVSILNTENGQPYFQVHPEFALELTKTPSVSVYDDNRRRPLTEQSALLMIERHRLLERLFRGEYREFTLDHTHLKCGQYGEIDGVWQAIRNDDNTPVVICVNSKTTDEMPSGLFIYHNTEIVADRKYHGFPVVHVFAYTSVDDDCIDLYQINLNKLTLACACTTSQSYHIIYNRDR